MEGTMPIPVIERIRQLLGDGDLDRACRLLMDELSKQVGAPLDQECLLFSSRLSSFRRQERKGLMTQEAAAVEANKLTDSLLFILRECERRMGAQMLPGNVSVVQAPRWFEQLPFPWHRPDSMELFHLLASAYSSIESIRALAQRVPISLLEWNAGGSVGQAWRSLIELASQQAKMGTLLEQVLREPGVAAIHIPLCELMKS
jgi:hypothetical protein